MVYPKGYKSVENLAGLLWGLRGVPTLGVLPYTAVALPKWVVYLTAYNPGGRAVGIWMN